ncbi:MAG TPA: hypothetical protein DCF91_01810 [Porphyromonadaceae bacterium]|nr:hypothetical protein [Porphyromonadaceae bacterium]
MKAIFIPFNQAYKDRLIEMMDKMNIRGFTFWEEVQGRGTKRGEPHYGSHAWPTMNSAIITMVPEDKVDELMNAIRELDMKTEAQGIHAYSWNIEKMV